MAFLIEVGLFVCVRKKDVTVHVGKIILMFGKKGKMSIISWMHKKAAAHRKTFVC